MQANNSRGEGAVVVLESRELPCWAAVAGRPWRALLGVVLGIWGAEGAGFLAQGSA